MADSVIGRAVLEITVDDKQYTVAMDKVARSTRDTAKEVNNLFSFEVLKTAGSKFVSFAETAGKAIAEVASTIVELGERGSDVNDVSNAFDMLSQRIGSTGETMRTALRDGVKGTVSDFELMQLANKTLGAGLVKSEADMRTLAEGAFLLANRTGGDAKEAFETLTSTMASGKVAQLKQLGLFVDQKVAVENYAKALGRAPGDLTTMERATALSQATMARLRTELEASGPATLDFGEKIKVARVEWENFKDRLGQAIATSGPLNAALSQIGAELVKAFGPEQKTLINAIVKAIEAVVLASSVLVSWTAEGVKHLVLLWTGFNETINGVVAGMLFNIASLVQGIADLAAKGSALPVVGGQFKALAEGLGGMAEVVRDGARNSSEAADGYRKIGEATVEAANAVSGGAARVATAMMVAWGSTTEATKAVSDFNGAAGDPAVAERSIENDQKIAASKAKLTADLLQLTTTGSAQREAAAISEYEANVARIMALKEIRGIEAAQQILQAAAIRDQKIAIAQSETDALAAQRQTLLNELTLMNTTADQQEVVALQQKQAIELAAIATLKTTNVAMYTELAALINQKYLEMTAAATGHYATADQAAAANGFKSRAELEATAQKAKATYELMKNNHAFTLAEQDAAKKKSDEAQTAINDTKTKAMMIADSSWANASVQLLQMLGGKFKAAAIAAVIISTAQAVMKTWATLGFPAAIPGAAVAIATGAVQVAKIKGQSTGFAEGTAGLDFQSFGTSTATNLHGDEAVIPRGKGHMLAGEIAGAMPGDNSATLERIATGIEGLPLMMKRAVRDGLLLAVS